ncbi:hypothetical protein HJY41_14230, partial [Barnesiella sp. GGCC_0306]|nr:hypothetical protein [Barnesiella sp. GGCC_0306]
TKLLDSISGIQHAAIAQNINFVILASPKIRLAFKKMIVFNFPDIAVLSLNEIPNEIAIETVGSIDI